MQIQSPEDIEPEFGRWVRERRTDAKLSQAELASRTGLPIDASAISRIESGTRSVRLAEAVAIGNALGEQVVAPVLGQRLDRVRSVVSEAREAAQSTDAAYAEAARVEMHLSIALEREAQALMRLADMVKELSTLSLSDQEWILGSIGSFARGNELRQRVFDLAVESASPHVVPDEMVEETRERRRGKHQTEG